MNKRKKAANLVLSYIASEKWAITEEWLKTIVSIARRENFEAKYDALLARGGEPLKNTRDVTIRGDAAILPLLGPVFPRANLFTEISGATSLEQISQDFAMALDNPEIKTIILQVDSPGGQVTGVAEFGQMIFEARSKKNIVAFVEGGANSAAFWIASQASQIILAPTAIVGSIGTMVTFTDRSKQLEQAGIEEIEIVSSLSPNKNRDPKTEEGRENVIEILDDLTRAFIDAVARGRNVSAETVLEKFGQGKTFVGQKAVDLGMADSIGTLETLIEQLTPNTNQLTGGFNMELDKLTAAELKTANPTLFNSIFDEGKNEGIKQGKTEGYEEGVQAENSRIKAVEEYEDQETKAIIAEHKFDSKKSADAIAAIVLKEQKAKTQANANDHLNDGSDLGNDADAIDGSSSNDDKDEANAEAVANMVKGASGRPAEHVSESGKTKKYRTLSSHA